MMSTFLLAWNPTKFPRGDLYAELASVRLKGKAVDYWSTWSREIASGDRLFLIRLGDRKRGIVGAGWAVEEPTEADHWDPEKASQGKKERYVGLVFDYLRRTFNHLAAATRASAQFISMGYSAVGRQHTPGDRC
jgi:5-methylcytosine-specific restriction protein B